MQFYQYEIHTFNVSIKVAKKDIIQMSHSIHRVSVLENKFHGGITGLKQNCLCDKKLIFKARFHHLVGLGVVTSATRLYAGTLPISHARWCRMVNLLNFLINAQHKVCSMSS